MNTSEYFLSPISPAQKRYEALRAYCGEKQPADKVAQQFGFSVNYLLKLKSELATSLTKESDPFFPKRKSGPKKRHTKDETVEIMVTLRKKNYSINDIKAHLHAHAINLSLDTIDKILKQEGFLPLPKRTKQERLAITPDKITAPRSTQLEVIDEEFITEWGAGALIFLPMLEKLGIVKAINSADFPQTNTLSDTNSVLSMLALKLIGNKRWSHDCKWSMDRALGLFAGLNVLPKSTTLSTYSYRVKRDTNKKLLVQLSKIFHPEGEQADTFLLDFKAIPHWGDDSVLEKNWAGTRSKAIKSIQALIVENLETEQLAYTNAGITHADQNDAILDFVDFWKQGHGTAPKMLIFDSKVTTYKNLNTLNKSGDNIKFLTLRRRGKTLIEQAAKLSESDWTRVKVERAKGKFQTIKIHDGVCSMRHYEGNVRQVIMTDHGREKPSFLITNDFDIDVATLIRKYARRWLVEQEIAEQIAFFHLNNPSSSIVIKVDLDLTLSLLAHNLYRCLAKELPGFEQCTAGTLHRKVCDNGAKLSIKDRVITVQLKKKTHLPILLSSNWMQGTTDLSWMGLKIKFEAGVYS